MTLYFSAATGGFYDDVITAVLPDDCVEITAETHAALMEAQAAGQGIAATEDGTPQAVERSAVSAIAGMTAAQMTAWVKACAKTRLSSTDWYVIRAAEDSSKAVPETVLAYRQAVRGVSNAFETEVIAAGSDESALAALAAPVWPDAVS